MNLTDGYREHGQKYLPNCFNKQLCDSHSYQHRVLNKSAKFLVLECNFM